MYNRKPLNFKEYDNLNNLEDRLNFIFEYGIITDYEKNLVLSKLNSSYDPLKNFDRSKYKTECLIFNNIPSLLGINLRSFIFNFCRNICRENSLFLDNPTNSDIHNKNWQQLMKNIVNENEFFRNISFDNLKKIIQSKNKQFKTAFRKPKTDPNYYKDIEYQKSRKTELVNLYGVKHSDLDFDEFPICGYLGLINHDGNIKYGNIKVQFKKENLLLRTTFTCGDSHDFYNKLTASFVTNPKITSLVYKNEKYCLKNLILAYNKSLAELLFNQLKIPYIELQFHGPVTLNDVSYLTVEKNEFYKNFDSDTLTLLKNFNIKFNIVESM